MTNDTMKHIQALRDLQEKERCKEMMEELGEEIAFTKCADSLDEVAELFFDMAMKFSKVARIFRGEENLWDADIEGEMERDDMVLYAVPGKAFELVPESYAIEEILKEYHHSDFKVHDISEDLFAVFPADIATYTAKGDVIVEGPLFVCYVNYEDKEVDESDFLEAGAYLALRTTCCKSENQVVRGFLLEKED